MPRTASHMRKRSSPTRRSPPTAQDKTPERIAVRPARAAPMECREGGGYQLTLAISYCGTLTLFRIGSDGDWPMPAYGSGRAGILAGRIVRFVRIEPVVGREPSSQGR